MILRLSTPKLLIVLGAFFMAFGVALGGASPKPESPAPAPAQESGTTATPLVAAPGLLVTGVQAGSPADKAGIVRGDIILEAGGTVVNTQPALQGVLDGKKSGEMLALKIRHGDSEKTANVTLGAGTGGRAWLGIAVVGSGQGRAFGLGSGRFGMVFPAAGAYVAGVVAGSPAEKAGLVVGDVILSVDGTAVDVQHPLADLIGAKKVGDTVTLSVQSSGQSPARDVKIALAKNPAKDAPWLGLQYTFAPRRGPMAQGLQTLRAGVFVAEVAADGPAAKAGIKARDIITKVEGATVADPQQVVDALAKHKPGDTLTVTVSQPPDNKELDVKVTLGSSPTDATKAYLGVSMSAFGELRGRSNLVPRFRGNPGGTTSPSTVTPPTI